ncbi:ribosome maturation factor RimM [Sphingomicrobium astaxanthinifaciens]|uniref:ribosome maturation factor RimM n=1 Tax=Sphingomicrobium astaxanthinifaciens TaxID=1227949 RepID=UPI001FCB49F3|nr:ribosome maturation factor RimM [Sphingomicrobium astaxanthinifaciens]MCJ7422277.1 ribosome maturation factor RimM [Sphingomicrobium astaxanthinifaciens]
MGGGSDDRIALAAIAGAHGIKGEVRLKLFAEGIASLKVHEALFVGGDERRLLSVREGGKNGAVARFEGVGDRTAAESLRGSLVEVAREALPGLDEGEYYFSDLLDLPVVADDDGEAIGTVVAVENYGASDVVEIEKPNGKRFMVPLTEDAVPEWDAERLVVARDFID